jgi:hypothetical protein
MKKGSGLLPAVAALLLLAAPSSAAAQGAPDLSVSDPQFAYDVNAGLGVRSAHAGKSPGPATTTTDSPVQRVSALFRNRGAKAVKSLTWEYVTYEDAALSKVRRVYTVRSRTAISPGESQRLWKEGYHLDGSPYRTARVTRIDYADGTTWQSTPRAKT